VAESGEALCDNTIQSISRAVAATGAQEGPIIKRNTALTCLVSLLTLGFGAASAQAPAATPSFTISASNITMPSSGDGSIPFTLTSVNGFAGSVGVTCTPPNPAAGVREPNCAEGGPVSPPYVLTANATAKGVSTITASEPLPVPDVSKLNRTRPREGTSWALAGVLMLGLGLNRKRSGQSTRLLLAVGMLIGLMGIGACSSPETLTPGTYTYTLNASSYVQNNTSLSASTTVTVTVPPGIVVVPTTGPVPLAP
jgi:hypothetical protein